MKRITKILLLIKLSLTVIYSSGQFQEIMTGTESDLHAIHFPDLQTGYVVGSSGTVLKTFNNGNNWLMIESGTNETIRGVWFTTPETGFIVGDNNTFKKTHDGGNSWTDVHIPVTADLMDIQFTSSMRGYIVGKTSQGSVLLKTKNKGENWEVHFIERNRFSAYQGYHSSDIIQIGSLSFRNDTTGLFGGYIINVRGERFPFVCKTSDGGNSFEYLNSKNHSQFGVEIRSVNYVTENDAYALKNSPSGNSTFFASSYWVDEIYPVERISNQPENETYYSSFFIDRFIGYVTARINGKPRILKTIDIGETFISLQPPTDHMLYGVHFLNSKHGFFIGEKGTMLRYTDDTNAPQVPTEGQYHEPAFAVAVPDHSNPYTDIFVYNINVRNEEDISIVFLNKNGQPVDVVRSKTKLYDHEVRMKLKFEKLSGIYYYVIKVNESPVVNGRLCASL